MGGFKPFEKSILGGRTPGKIEASLNEKLKNVEWGEYKLGDLFEICNTLSFNSDMLVAGNDYDYVTRTSLNQGVLQTTGFVNAANINQSGTWSLGLLQMDFFYRSKPWYAGQFVRKIVPKFKIPKGTVLFFTTLLNKQKKRLLSVLVRNVDKTFKETIIKLPITKGNKIDFDFMESFVAELEAERVAELSAYLKASGLDNYELYRKEEEALEEYKNNNIVFAHFTYNSVFNKIVQGRRLKKDDQIPGNIPFVMSGTTNNGIVNFVSNPVASFPQNSITLDIFGNAFYRNYAFGAGDDTGVYWNNQINYSKNAMLFLTTAMEKSIKGKYSYGKKLRSSQSHDFVMQLPAKNDKPDFEIMENLISAVQKLVIKDVVLYSERKIDATKYVLKNNLHD